MKRKCEKKMGKTHKNIYLAIGREDGWKWRLSFPASRKNYKWGGSFSFQKARKLHMHKTIHLTSGGEDGWGWQLNLNVSAKQTMWDGTFSLADETRKYRIQLRAADRYWAARTFPQRWLQQFQIHHRWSDETCYFLTPTEHLEQDKILRYAAQ